MLLLGFVSDVARANLLALKADCVGPFNIGTGKETDVNTLFGHLRRLTASSLPEKHHSAKPGEQQRSVLNWERAAQVLGWRPEVELKEGLRLTVEYFQRNLHKTQLCISGERIANSKEPREQPAAASRRRANLVWGAGAEVYGAQASQPGAVCASARCGGDEERLSQDHPGRFFG